MTAKGEDELSEYYAQAQSWADDRERRLKSASRVAWIIAGISTTIALLEAIAIVALAPLKTVVPYTLLVDRQTGYVQALKPTEGDMIAPDEALTRSFLAQYVIAREGFTIETLKDDYRKVALWSAGDARVRYLADMQATNPQSPLATIPRGAILEVEIRSMSSLSPRTSLIRFATIRSDPGGQQKDVKLWAAVATYRFSGAAMSAADRLVNPLGFQVMRYRRDAEIAPTTATENPPRPPATQAPLQPQRLP